MLRQFVYPSQNIASSAGVTELTFKVPRSSDVWACGASSLSLAVETGAGTVGVLNANGFLLTLRGHRLAIDGRTICNDTDLSSFAAFNARSRSTRAHMRDVSKYAAGMNDDAEQSQVTAVPDASGLSTVTTSTFAPVVDTLLSLRESNTNNAYVCSIPLGMISSVYAQSIPLYLIRGDIEITLTIELAAARLTLPLAAGTATALTLSDARLFSCGFSYTDKSTLPRTVRHTFNQIQTNSLPFTGASSAAMNVSLAGQRVRRLFVQWRQSFDTMYGASASRFDNASVFPTIQLVVDNAPFWTKPIPADYSAMLYTCADASVYGYSSAPGSLCSADSPLMSAGSIDGTATAYNLSAGQQNVIVANLGGVAYARPGAASSAENVYTVGDTPIQIQIQAPTGAIATGTLLCHAEVQRDVVFSAGTVDLL